YFPSSVIKGMLAAIGIILILKEIPHFLGFDDDAFGEMSFTGTDGRNTFEEILYATTHMHKGAFAIGLISLALMLFWDSIKVKFPIALKIIPGALIAVVVGIFLNESVFVSNPELFISGNHLVSLPIAQNIEGFKAMFKTPDFSFLASP